jgi:Zn-dependent alcohol dehydrogenase
MNIPDDVTLEDATIFGCAVVTGVGAVPKTVQVPRRARMAVVGLAGVGMVAVEKTIRDSYIGGFVTFGQINEGFDKLAVGAVPRRHPRSHA